MFNNIFVSPLPLLMQSWITEADMNQINYHAFCQHCINGGRGGGRDVTESREVKFRGGLTAMMSMIFMYVAMVMILLISMLAVIMMMAKMTVIIIMMLMVMV